MHRPSEISPVASCLVHEEKFSPFYMFHKLKYIEQCNFVITFIQWKDDGWLRRGVCDGLDSEVYLFIDSPQLEAAVGSPNDLLISCHVLGSVDAMLRFIHAVGSLKLPVLLCMHVHNKSFWCLYVVCTHSNSSIFVVPSSIGHPPHSSASPVELCLRVGPRALSGKKNLE